MNNTPERINQLEKELAELKKQLNNDNNRIERFRAPQIDNKGDLRNGDVLRFKLTNGDEHTVTIISDKTDKTVHAYNYAVRENIVVGVFDKIVLFEDRDPEDTEDTLLYIKQMLPTKLLEFVEDIVLPSKEEVFGDRAYDYFKDRKNRMGLTVNDDLDWWWLDDELDNDGITTTFADVDHYGYPSYDYASFARGFRPLLILKSNIDTALCGGKEIQNAMPKL